MNRSNVEYQITTAHLHNNKEAIKDIYIDLINLKAKLDRWFNKYLDMFDEKMSSVTRSDPMWKLYHSKADEYSQLTQTIKTAEYFLKKQ